MRAAVNALATWSAAAALLLSPGGGAAATDPAAPERAAQRGADRWVPSLAPVVFGATFQRWRGDVQSLYCPGCTLPSPSSRALRPSASGDDTDVTPFFGGALELMTPELPLPARPRLFVGGEIAATFGVDRTLALEGDPGTIKSPFPPPPPGSDEPPWDEDAAQGQGSETVATLASPFWGAYAGVAFPFRLFGRQLRVRPSFAWLRYSIDVEGTVLDAECRQVASSNNCNEVSQGFLRAIQLNGSDTGTFDGIGPGLDLEMETGAWGPLGTSIFLGSRAYHILGERTLEFETTRSYPDQGPGLPAADASGRWSFEVEPWLFRIFVGVRVQWLGFAP